ncbi:MAG: oxidoreductase, 2OG-Fe(II) oxygenase [Bacteroidia bacterium]|nr:oxidoreductase, 2OG-Fe(II) oxygenase [Bacteroidia bacterium]
MINLTPITDTLLTLENFLSDSECQHYIALSESLGYEMAQLDIGKVVPDIRNNDRVFYESAELAELLFQRSRLYLIPKIGHSTLVGLNERFRFYRYQPGHRFKGHQDGRFIRNEVEASYFTFMIYLNEGFKGGETTFLQHTIKPQQGMALVFLHKLFHEGSEVIKGVKYVLRSDVMYRFAPPGEDDL